jgi:hypothetical protein
MREAESRGCRRPRAPDGVDRLALTSREFHAGHWGLFRAAEELGRSLQGLAEDAVDDGETPYHSCLGINVARVVQSSLASWFLARAFIP